MSPILPQQRLLLELLCMSGDIAATDDLGDCLLARTLKECEAAGWIEVKHFGAGFNKVHITDHGRTLAKKEMDHA